MKTEQGQASELRGFIELVTLIAGFGIILFSKNDIARAICIVGLFISCILDAYFSSHKHN